MNEPAISVEGLLLHRLAQHFLMCGSQYLEPLLGLLGESYEKPRHYQLQGLLTGQYAILASEDSFFSAIAPNRGTYATAVEADFGGSYGGENGLPTTSTGRPGSPAPWAAQLTADWNAAVAARAADMTTVIDQLYKLGDALITVIEDYESQDIYNADGIVKGRDGYDYEGQPEPAEPRLESFD